MTRWIGLTALMLIGCESASKTEDGEMLTPVLEIVQPSTLSQFREYEDIAFSGSLSGVPSPNDYIGVWNSDLDGDFYSESFNAAGQSQFAYGNLTPGDHVITFTTLMDGTSVSDSIDVTITDEIDAPTVSLVSPQGDYSAVGENILFSVIVDDLQDLPTDLVVEGASDLAGQFCTMTVEADGLASCTTALVAGEHAISITATDTHGFVGELNFTWSVLTPEQIDDDGDGFSEEDGDCDDANPNISPSAPELADQIDNNCNGIVDDATPYYDDDGDCFCETVPCNGTVADLSACGVLQGGDCNDSSNLDSPAGDERCDGLDNDCDGSIDEYSAVDATVWYVDADGDGFGNSSYTQPACSQPQGYSSNDQDCNDNDTTINPSATEQPNGIDDDCDGIVDDNTVNYDDDLDGFTENDGDCDDGNPMVNPAQVETINAVDDDCNGLIDDQTTLYDDDGDGFSENQGDCDDMNIAVAPNLTEICGNGVDDNCNGSENEINAIDCVDFYHDADGDGYGGSFYPSECWCDPGGNSGMLNVTVGGDCMDTVQFPRSNQVYPDQTMFFDIDRGDGSFDYDCNGAEDKYNDQLGSCSWSWFTCDVDNQGWVGSVPVCGDTGEFIENDDHCSNAYGVAGCDIDEGIFPYTQTCR